MRILLLEDEIIVVRDLKARLKTMGYDDVHAFDDGKDLLAYVKENGADLCLVDININGDLNGIQTVARLPEKQRMPIIYLTSQGDKQTFEQAKETKPSAYLLKPYNAFELQTAIELAIDHFEGEPETNEEDKGLHIIDDKVFIRHSNRYDRIKVSDILYLEAFGNYTEIHTKVTKYTIVNQLGKIERTLSEKFMFRCHRSFIVNLDAVDGFDDSYVFIHNKSIPIAKGQRAEFLSRLRIL